MSDHKDDAAVSTSTRGKPLKRIVDDMVHLAPWRKKLLAFFLAIASIGGALWIHGWVTAEPAPEVQNAEVRLSTEGGDENDRPAGARGFVAEGARQSSAGEAGGTPEISTEPAGMKSPWSGRLGGWMARLGVSFVAGLIIGVFFRMFLKTMAIVTALAVAALVGLSYFEVIDVDFANLRENYDGAAGWLNAQAGNLKSLAMGVLPSLTAGGAGFLVGFLRK